MDKFNVRISNLTLVLLILITSGCSSIKYSRPIEITVIDDETQQPIENIQVFYGLEEIKLQKTLFNLFPIAGAYYDFYYSSESKNTDKNGKVSFENMNKIGKKYESDESIFINLNIDRNGWMSIFEAQQPNINKVYFGIYISNFKQCFDSNEIKSWVHQPVSCIDVLVNGGSLKKTKENLTIKLRRFDSTKPSGIRNEVLCDK
jgi:hypothetical protein